jgi:glycoside/pentoside/hexuronide:cation symporter, GPH family
MQKHATEQKDHWSGSSYDARPPLTLFTQITYSLGMLAYGVKDLALGSMLLFFWSQVVGLPSAWVGAAIGVGLVVDAILDPLIGYASDNLRSKWGRRHPFMYAAAVPSALAFYFLFNPPVGWPIESMFVYMMVTTLGLRIAISFYEVPSAAVGAELTLDYDKRTTVMAYRFFFGGEGAALLAIVTYGFLLQATPDDPNGMLNLEGYANFGLFGAIVIFFSIIIASWGIHHFIPYFHVPPKIKINPIQIFREMFATLATRNYLVLILSGIFGAIFAGVNSGLGLYLRTFFWEMTSANIAVLSSAGLIAPIIAVLSSTWLSKRYGKKHTALGVLVAAVVVFLIPVSLRLIGFFPPNGSPWLVPLLWIDTLTWASLLLISFIQGASMIADLAEEVAVKTGRRSEGVLFSANAIIQQSITGVGVFLAGLLLAWVNFPQNVQPGQVDQSLIDNLAILYLAAAVVLNVPAVAILYLYTHNRDQHETNLAILREAHAREMSMKATDTPT